jgi:DNA-binding transcriptional MerR regulator
VYDTNDDEVLGLDMKKLKVILSKSTGYTYLEAKVVKEHIDALEEGRENDEFENRLRYDEVSSELESLKKKISLNGKIDILSRLYQIWAMIPLTAGMNARKEIKKLIDEIEKAPLHS